MSEEANSDELAAFVTSTLIAVSRGIEAAQGAQITSAHGTGVFGFTAPAQIEFDVAVSAKQTGTAEGGLKVSVFGIGAGAKGVSADENSTVSRIRFIVPTNFKRTAPLPAKRRVRSLG